MLASVAASAQTTVQITPISATYTNSPTVQFKVSWTNQTTANHRNKVWVFVDFQPVISLTQKGNWQPATITGTVQKTAGTVSEQSNRGFFLEGATTNFSSTVTVELSNTGTQFNWCAYASDCPPNVGDYNNGTYTLRGTPPFTLKDVSGTTQKVLGKTIVQSSLTITPITMTDATGCPGYFCKYIGSDLYMNDTYKCGLRTSGAKNWEAWIKDSRDNELYRVVLMPDDNWWTAEEMRYDASATHQSYKCPTGEMRMIYNRPNVACPAGWILPSVAQFLWLHANVTDAELLAAHTYQYYGTGSDKYGFSLIPDPGRYDSSNESYPQSCRTDFQDISDSWDTSDGLRLHALSTLPRWYWQTNALSWNQVRCIRQL